MFTNASNASVVKPTFREMIAELSADEKTPIAFSHAPLFHAPQYGLFAEIRHSRLLGDYVYYAICKRHNGDYDHKHPVYESSSFEDISDVWAIFAKG